MELGLQGRRALVTGSTKGIGRAIATELAREGADVVINGRNAEEVARVTAAIREAFPETNPRGIAADLTSEADRTRLFETFPNVDVLVNNVGIFEPMSYWDITEEVWLRFIRANVLAGDALARHYLRGMLARNDGRVIFIASEEAVMPSGQIPQYSMTKTMELSLAKSMAKLTRGTAVTVNTVLPGSTRTDGVEAMLASLYADSGLPSDEWERRFMAEHRPLSDIGRLIRPEEIGRFVAFVASPLSGAFSGAALRMDGGLVPTIW